MHRVRVGTRIYLCSQTLHSSLYSTLFLGQVLVGTGGLVNVSFALLTLLVPLTALSLTAAAALVASLDSPHIMLINSRTILPSFTVSC